MTVSVEPNMTDRPETQSNRWRNPLLMVGAALFIVLTAGAIVGFVDAHNESGDTFTGMDVMIIALMAAIITGLAYAIFRLARRAKTYDGPLTRREKLNRNILVACAIAGAIVGGILAIDGNGAPADVSVTAFSETPLPRAIAISLALFWGIAMPVTAWFWHTRAIDEQEAAAYRDGGYYAAYAYLIGAPLWWFLWRGGILPEPDGVVIFVSFSFLWCAVWYWKKYR